MVWTITLPCIFFLLLVLTFNLCVQCKPQISDTYFCVYVYKNISWNGYNVILMPSYEDLSFFFSSPRHNSTFLFFLLIALSLFCLAWWIRAPYPLPFAVFFVFWEFVKEREKEIMYKTVLYVSYDDNFRMHALIIWLRWVWRFLSRHTVT